MKLCPQCAFVYEDSQRFCDMDGKVLVPDLTSVVTQSSASPPTRVTINIPARLERPTERVLQKARSRRLPVLITVGGIVLVMLLAVLYFNQLYRAGSSDPVQSSHPSSARSVTQRGQPSPADLALSTSGAVTPLPMHSPEESSAESLPLSTNTTAQGLTSPPTLPATPVIRTRLTSSPVSAGGLPANNRGKVLVRLTNGAIISADEAWERREGIWYRQAGLVTFLKRGRVRTIERLEPQPKSIAKQENEKSRKSESSAGKNQFSLRRLEPAETKKQSRVSSFLKVTGRILKKPFKL